MIRWLRKKNKPQNEWIALNLTQQNIELVHLSKKANQTLPEIRLSESLIGCTDAKSLKNVLSTWVKQHRLTGTTCSWALSPNHYQMILIDNLNVPTEELIPAVRWRIKDLLTYSPEDASIDVFAIPPHGRNNQHKKLYVVSAQTSYLQPFVKAIQESGLQLTHIDIPELTQLRLIYTMQNQDVTIGIMTFRDEGCELLICRGGALYLARLFDLTLDAFETNPDALLENTWLETQRSYDYCETQLGLDPPAKLFVIPIFAHYQKLATYLQERLSSELIIPAINTIIEIPTTYTLPFKLGSFFALTSSFTRYLEEEGTVHVA